MERADASTTVIYSILECLPTSSNTPFPRKHPLSFPKIKVAVTLSFHLLDLSGQTNPPSLGGSSTLPWTRAPLSSAQAVLRGIWHLRLGRPTRRPPALAALRPRLVLEVCQAGGAQALLSGLGASGSQSGGVHWERQEQVASRNKCIATSNKCLTSSNKKLLGTSS